LKRNVGMKILLFFAIFGLLFVGCSNGGHSEHGGHGETGGDEGHAGHGDSMKAGQAFPSLSYDGGEMKVRFENEQKNVVKEFEIAHEKLLHLIVVSKDLTDYYHLHPTLLEDGTFELKQAFPDGSYTVFADAKPVGYNYEVQPLELSVGNSDPNRKPSLTPDPRMTQTIKDVTVTMSPDTFNAGEEITLDYVIEGGQPEPYLGALGHVVILNEAGNEYVHVHPLSESETRFATHFENPGLYKLWAEFKIGGEVIVYPYVIEVKGN
jgi:hypothetical protein